MNEYLKYLNPNKIGEIIDNYRENVVIKDHPGETQIRNRFSNAIKTAGGITQESK
jgi:hypothetical protein